MQNKKQFTSNVHFKNIPDQWFGGKKTPHMLFKPCMIGYDLLYSVDDEGGATSSTCRRDDGLHYLICNIDFQTIP